jgi:hypothetical protein
MSCGRRRGIQPTTSCWNTRENSGGTTPHRFVRGCGFELRPCSDLKDRAHDFAMVNLEVIFRRATVTQKRHGTRRYSVSIVSWFLVSRKNNFHQLFLILLSVTASYWNQWRVICTAWNYPWESVGFIIHLCKKMFSKKMKMFHLYWYIFIVQVVHFHCSEICLT